MEYIFLDTSIFFKENFLESKKIKSILKYGKDKKIKVIMPLLTYNEILKQVDEEVRKSFNKISILKNSVPIKDIIWNNGIEDVIKEIRQNLEKAFQESNFEMIDYSSNPNIIKEVFDDYFEGKPPFGDAKKKSEFPDAFTLKILEEYAVKNNIEISVFSADKDYSDFQSKCLKIQNADDFGKFINDKIEKL